MASVTLAGPQVVNVRFQRDVSGARKVVEACALELQSRIASEFERVATYAGPLARNTSAYNVQKALEGYDLRRGHRTGALQSAINNQRLYAVSGGGRNWRIRFSDRPILSAVGHARYYIPQKVQGGKIAGVRRDWLEGCRERLDAAEKGSAQSSQPAIGQRRPLEQERGLLENILRFISG